MRAFDRSILSATFVLSFTQTVSHLQTYILKKDILNKREIAAHITRLFIKYTATLDTFQNQTLYFSLLYLSTLHIGTLNIQTINSNIYGENCFITLKDIPNNRWNKEIKQTVKRWNAAVCVPKCLSNRLWISWIILRKLLRKQGVGFSFFSFLLLRTLLD